MRLSWNEIRTRAANFAREWDGEGYEKGQTQLFYRDFFEVFGVPVRRVASFEEPVKNLGEKRGFIDLFWKGVLLIEQKSLGRDLKKAKTQALNYFPGLKDSELPRFILLSDFQSFELYDLEEDEKLHITLADLPKHVEKFGFVIGVERRQFKDQDPVNIEASETVIASNKLQIITNAPLYYFGILTSAMHMAWMRTVAGRLESRYSYAPAVYNSFPWPTMTPKQQASIETLAQAVLDARSSFKDTELDVLYDQDSMPPTLRKAHAALDKAVDQLYRRKGFAFERERVEHLFELYETSAAPMAAQAKKARRKKAV